MSDGANELGRLLAIARDATAGGHVVQATGAVIALSDQATRLSTAQRIDLLERACVYGPRMLVDFVWEELGPFAYRGWALALALRCAREDVARDLLARGVTLMEDTPLGETYRTIAAHESSLSRFDLTRSSKGLFMDAFQRTVCSEVFAPFSGNEQLVGGSFATSTNLAATCDVVGRLASEGLFCALEFDDLLRCAIVRAAELRERPDPSQPEARDACLGLAAHMLVLHDSRGMGDDYLGLVLGNFLGTPRCDQSTLAWLCERAPQAFYEALDSFSWISHDGALVRSLVSHLRPGTHEQNAHLATLLAECGYLDELKVVAAWPNALTPEGVDQAMDAASHAGHAKVASWLLGYRRSLVPQGSRSKSEQEDLSSLLL